MGRGIKSLPFGIEQVLTRAATDPGFAVALFEERDAALEASEISLTGTERAVLKSLSDPLLTAMIAGLRRNLVGLERRAFLRKSMASAAVLLACAQSSGCECSGTGQKGMWGHVEDDEWQREMERSLGIKKRPENKPQDKDDDSQRLREARRLMKERYSGSLGIRPDRPDVDADRSLFGHGDETVVPVKAFGGLMGRAAMLAQEKQKISPL